MAGDQKQTNRILNPTEERVLVDAIREAEKRTSGEIVVHILNKLSGGDALHAARRVFTKLGIHKTKHRNGVLILIIEKDRKLACLGDQGIHERVDGVFWSGVVRNLEAEFKNGTPLTGLLAAIKNIADVLERHFPASNIAGNNPNELADEISRSDD